MISCVLCAFVQDMAPNKLSIIASYDYNLSFYTAPNPKLTVRQLFFKSHNSTPFKSN